MLNWNRFNKPSSRKTCDTRRTGKIALAPFVFLRLRWTGLKV